VVHGSILSHKDNNVNYLKVCSSRRRYTAGSGLHPEPKRLKCRAFSGLLQISGCQLKRFGTGYNPVPATKKPPKEGSHAKHGFRKSYA
jgi:hypothetical protein